MIYDHEKKVNKESEPKINDHSKPASVSNRTYDEVKKYYYSNPMRY